MCNGGTYSCTEAVAESTGLSGWAVAGDVADVLESTTVSDGVDGWASAPPVTLIWTIGVCVLPEYG